MTSEDAGARRNLNSTELKRLHREWRRRTPSRLALILDAVQNPFNLGAILRTAAAMSVDRIWMVGSSDASENKVQKTALGSQRFVTTIACDSIADAMAAGRDAGFRLVGVELARESTPMFDLDLSGDVCLVIGHEDRGLSREALAGCDALGYLPQTGKIGSLNVATATAIACWEVRRTGWTSDTPE